MNKIIFYSYLIAVILFILFIHNFSDYINPEDICILGFCFSGLGGLISLGMCLLRWYIEDRQIEEDYLFDHYEFEFEEDYY